MRTSDAGGRPDSAAAAAIWLLVALIPLLTAPMNAAAQELPPTGFEPGEPFPTLTLPALDDGRALSVADFRGHKTIVHVFASW